MSMEHRFFLGGSLPDRYKGPGPEVVFNTDFRAWLQYERIQEQVDILPEEKLAACLACCVRSMEDGADLTRALAWFHTCADIERVERIKIPKRAGECLAQRKHHISQYWDFFQLWASFRSQYDIDLYTCGELHWWEFKRLVEDLKPVCQYLKLRDFRAMSKDEFYQKNQTKELNRKWGVIELDQRLIALPE